MISNKQVVLGYHLDERRADGVARQSSLGQLHGVAPDAGMIIVQCFDNNFVGDGIETVERTQRVHPPER